MMRRPTPAAPRSVPRLPLAVALAAAAAASPLALRAQAPADSVAAPPRPADRPAAATPAAATPTADSAAAAAAQQRPRFDGIRQAATHAQDATGIDRRTVRIALSVAALATSGSPAGLLFQTAAESRALNPKNQTAGCRGAAPGALCVVLRPPEPEHPFAAFRRRKREARAGAEAGDAVGAGVLGVSALDPAAAGTYDQLLAKAAAGDSAASAAVIRYHVELSAAARRLAGAPGRDEALRAAARAALACAVQGHGCRTGAF